MFLKRQLPITLERIWFITTRQYDDNFLTDIRLPATSIPYCSQKLGNEVTKQNHVSDMTSAVSSFGATVCKTVCPMLCPVFLSLTLLYSGQTVGWIKMPLGAEVGLDRGHIVFDGDPAPPHGKEQAASPPPTFWPTSTVAKRSSSQQLLGFCYIIKFSSVY